MTLNTYRPWVYSNIGRGVLSQTGGGGIGDSDGSGIPDVIIAASNSFRQEVAHIVCDGINDHEQFLAALALLDGRPGWIHFLAGDYVVGQATYLEGPSELRLTGAGLGLTQIKASATFNDTAVFWHGGSVDTPHTLQRLTIEWMTIDGNKAGGAVMHRGLISPSLGSAMPVRLRDVELQNSSAVGLGSEGAVGRSGNQWYLSDLYVHSNNGAGMALHECSTNIEGTISENNLGPGMRSEFGGFHHIGTSKFENNGGTGFDGTGLLGRARLFTTASSYSNNGGGGIAIGTLASPSVIVANRIQDNAGNSVIVTGGSVVQHNLISGNGVDQPQGDTSSDDDNPLTSNDVLTFFITGEVPVVAGSMRFVFPEAAVIEGVQAAVGTPPTGASLIVDTNKNFLTLFIDQNTRPTITAGQNLSPYQLVGLAVAAGDYLTVDVDQIGAVTPGEDLTVMIHVKWGLVPGE